MPNSKASSDHLLLLTPPTTFTRQENHSFLFRPRSAKLQRRLTLYGPPKYDLWLEMEAEQSIKTFNEEVPPVPIVLNSGQAGAVAPEFASLSADGQLTIHTFAPLEEGTSNEPKWADWCAHNGHTHRMWSANDLHGYPVRSRNLKKLHSFLCVAGEIPDVQVETRITAELREVRRSSVHRLVKQLPSCDPQVVVREIARLIIAGIVYCDINSEPFDMLSELSIHRPPASD